MQEYIGDEEVTEYNEVETTVSHKKCINKEERVRHLPGYCPQTSQETKDAEER